MSKIHRVIAPKSVNIWLFSDKNNLYQDFPASSVYHVAFHGDTPQDRIAWNTQGTSDRSGLFPATGIAWIASNALDMLYHCKTFFLVDLTTLDRTLYILHGFELPCLRDPRCRSAQIILLLPRHFPDSFLLFILQFPVILQFPDAVPDLCK